MKNLCISTILTCLIAFSLPTKSFAADPLAQSCDFIDALVDDGADGVVRYAKSAMVAHWGEEDQIRLFEPMRNLLEPHDFVSGRVFLIGDLGGDMHEHLLILKRDTFGNFYGRIVYEKLGPVGFGMRTMMLEDDFAQISRRPYLQEPVPLPCD